MNAVKIMLFLLMFNVALSIVGGLHIFNMQTTGNYDMDDVTEHTGESAIWFFVGGQTVAALIAGAIGGAIIGYVGGRIPTSEGIAYGVFAGLITSVFVTSSAILGGIVTMVPPYAQSGVAVIIGLFLGITGLLFVLGFIQLIRGGMKSYI